ncbi:MAG TPA: ParA family protein [Geobacteraceae bacterium]|nr:ParA family protein [Geobacteraceae bacterium]
MKNFPYVITVSSEKGGVGKTTLATNLAIYLKALSEDLPVSVVSLDNHFTVDKMFAIKGQKVTGDISDFLLEKPGASLLHTGQYGVNYIPSSMSLEDLRDSIKGTLVLSRLLAISDIPGILIIDTRPELNIFTQNALYAADRVIIPVKDMPSLENCRNIFELFDKRGFDRKSLSIMPCLIDARIKYRGPFKDHKSLLRAFAINRGYRCCEGYISKSPKVESLNTNPEGKIYPILTHARGTDVYGQYAQLGREILDEYRSVRKPRTYLFYQWLVSEEQRKADSLRDRLARLKDRCLLCGDILTQDKLRNVSFYYEASDGGACGFLDEYCCSSLLLSCLYDAKPELPENDPLLLMFRESGRESVYALRPFVNGTGPEVEIRRFTMNGSPVQKKTHPLREFEDNGFIRKKSTLYSFLLETLGEHPGRMRDAFILIYPTSPNKPESVLGEESYKRLLQMMRHVSREIGVSAHLTNFET